jgi:hypothetical protein
MLMRFLLAVLTKTNESETVSWKKGSEGRRQKAEGKRQKAESFGI